MINDYMRKLREAFQNEGFDIRIVGGAVRDYIFSIEPKDIDFCTNATPLQQIIIYNKYNYKFILTGIDHGTITVVINDVPYEITTLRKDVETDGRHAKVEFTDNWVEDLARRDLTINAMSFGFNGDILDPFGGQDDLKNGIVRFVGNADERIKEDYLRILRWFRFMGRFGDHDQYVVTDQIDVIKRNVHGLQDISVERIWSEMKKILMHYSARIIISIMQRSDVLDVIMSYGLDDYNYDNLTKAQNVTSDPAVVMAALVSYDVDIIKKLYEDWHWSNAEYNHALWIAQHYKKYNYQRMIAVDNAPKEWVIELAKINNESFVFIETLEEWTYEPFPVNGGDLLKIGILSGPRMGKVLKSLKDVWATTGYSATKEELMKEVN